MFASPNDVAPTGKRNPGGFYLVEFLSKLANCVTLTKNPLRRRCRHLSQRARLLEKTRDLCEPWCTVKPVGEGLAPPAPPMKKYYRVNVVGHNDVILNRNTSETRFNQLQLLFYNLAARLLFYNKFGRSKPLPYHCHRRVFEENSRFVRILMLLLNKVKYFAFSIDKGRHRCYNVYEA